jgi:hypothetical protein
LKEDGQYGVSAASKFQKLLNPIRKASSSALASFAEKRRSSAVTSETDLLSKIEPPPSLLSSSAPSSSSSSSSLRSSTSLVDNINVPKKSTLAVIEEDITPRRRSNTIGAQPIRSLFSKIAKLFVKF